MEFLPSVIRANYQDGFRIHLTFSDSVQGTVDRGEAMTQIARQDFTNTVCKLLKETFEDGGSIYLDKGAGLFQTLEAITPEVASRAPVPGAPTVAAHCAHISYYVRVVHNFIVG